MPTRTWYWPSEVADMLHVSKTTVYKWIESGKIQPLLTCRPFKIPAQEVEKLRNPHLLSS